MKQTTMTEEEYAEFYNAANPTSFQKAYTDQLLIIKNFYGCIDLPNNCTADEIANLQWGSALITKTTTPEYAKNSYLQPTESVKDWGLYIKPVEYDYYMTNFVQANLPLNMSSVDLIFSNITGITDENLATIFVINVSAGRNISEYS